MNKAGVIDAVAKSLDCSKSSADVYVNTILETIKEGVRDTGKVQLMGFGTFEARQTKAREGRNPRPGEPMMIKASTRCAFKVGKQFKEMLCAKTLETEAAAEAAPVVEIPATPAPMPETPVAETAGSSRDGPDRGCSNRDGSGADYFYVVVYRLRLGRSRLKASTGDRRRGAGRRLCEVSACPRRAPGVAG